MILPYHTETCKSAQNRGNCTPMFIVALFIIAKLCNQPRCPSTDEWVKKMWYMYACKYVFYIYMYVCKYVLYIYIYI
jgi:hypothetical protein